jgi:ABC-type iron transport system FetAB ATPase subunit
MRAAELVLILGPEGCGKSSAIMGQIPRLITEIDGTVFFSSPSYTQAREKLQEFSDRFRGTDSACASKSRAVTLSSGQGL